MRNRGRRDARIESVTQARRWRGAWSFGDLAGQVPFDLPAETSKKLLLGAEGGYEHGDIRTRRFYVVDGADRVHPLRERARRRIGGLVYGWLVRLYFERKRKKLREADKQRELGG